MSTAPDYCQPVVGWRLWTLAVVDGRARLASHVSPSVWEPGCELVASCEVRRRPPLAPWRLLPTGHAAPAERCTCGVHAMGVIGALGTYLPQANRPYSWMRPVVRQVVGRVSLWGLVVEGARGWRGARAYPAELWLPQADVDGHEFTDTQAEGFAIDLADYGVPVHLCDGRTVRGVVEELAAADRARPLTAS
ncbi:MAG TPA: hypothetical protein VGL44_14965 [Gaiellales bacterium]